MNIAEVRESTYNDVLEKLNKYGKCFVIRPTGFGKTYMMAGLMQQYKNVLFLYPTNIVADVVKRVYGDLDYSNITFMSYLAFVKADIKSLSKFDLVVCDEAHRLGGEKTNMQMKALMELLKGTCHFIGLTATPNRMDGYDMISDLFDGINVFHYSIHNSIEDGNTKKPYVCYMSYGYMKDIEQAIKAGEKRIKVKLDADVRASLIKRNTEHAMNVYGRDKNIREMCDKYLEDTSYMKFICFFPTKKQLTKLSAEVIKDFKTAYPTHTIETLTITSDSEYVNNVDKLSDLTHKKDTIQLIFCIDMLNMGYHVDDLTGIVMYRSTDSSIIYGQQIGRCMSTIDVDPRNKIIFDFVDNINRRCIVQERNLTTAEGRKTSEFSEDNSILMQDDVVAVGRVAEYRDFYNKVEGEVLEALSNMAYWKWRSFGGGKDRPDVKIDFFCILYGVTGEDVLKTMKIDDIYDPVDESTKVPDYILDKTGTIY